jgi:putative transposase
MTRFIEKERHRFGVEPICRVIDASASTYYAHQSRPPSRRRVSDAVLLDTIRETWRRNYSCYGSRRMWLRLQQNGVDVGRDRVKRLMRQDGLRGVVRGRTQPRTTICDEKAARPADLVERRFLAERPNALWVTDFTYCWTLDGTCYAAFVLDVYSRKIVGWQLSHTMRTELVLDALEMALHQRRIDEDDRLIHHSDAGSQYTSIVYTDRLDRQGVAASVGSVGDAYDNAMAEAVINTYKHELVRNAHVIPDGKRWASLDELYLATVAWVGWYNHDRLHSALDDRSPIDYERLNYKEDNIKSLSTR